MDTKTTHVFPVKDKPLKKLNQITKKPALNIEFADLEYSVSDINFKKGSRQILNSISGKFCSGEITVILGPSGAGKSTLLNILTGYVNDGVEGKIMINNNVRCLDVFKKLSCYVIQDDILQPRLTVKEAMTYAARLKLGEDIKDQDKTSVVEEVIDFLGLKDCLNTRSEYLSGGQKKRLSIALELVNNPAVIFLDEPTTGLDDFAVKHSIDLLKKISQLGRTVICTIHQPSAYLFQYFDQVYIMAEGCCVYSGTPLRLVDFLKYTGYVCPLNYTPADYMIELVNLDPSTIDTFKKCNQNRKLHIQNAARKNVMAVSNSQAPEIVIETKNQQKPFLTQFLLILSRQCLQLWRSRAFLFMQFLSYVSVATIIALMFIGTGQDAANAVSIVKLCLVCNVYFSYMFVMPPTLIYPFEIRLMEMEYFNRWYSLKAYYAALTISTLPLLIISVVIFSTIVYFVTDQPLELNRFIGFFLVNLMVGLTSQGLGYLIGSMFHATHGAAVAPILLAALIVLSMQGAGQQTPIAPIYKAVMKISFLRDGVLGICSTLFYERKPLICKEIYCHYKDPAFMLKDNSMPLIHYTYHILHLFGYLILFRVLWYFTLKYRLSLDLSSRIVFHFKRIIIYFKQICE